MKIRYLIKIMIESLFNKRFVVLILLAMSNISVYMTDVMFTDYYARKHYISRIDSMFGYDAENVNYVQYLNLMNPDYTVEKGDELIDFIKKHNNVLACGRFCSGKAQKILNDSNVNAVIVEKDITIMGNLGISNENQTDLEDYNLVYVGYNLKKYFNIGDEFDFYVDTDDSKCVVAGYLDKNASWPIKGNMFAAVATQDSFTLEDKIVVVTKNYEVFDNSGGMPDIIYFIVDNQENISQVQSDIIKKSADNNLGVKVVNEGQLLKQQKENNNITENKSFVATVLLFLLALLSMSAASIVFCLIGIQEYGIMVISGVSKKQLIIMNYIENIMFILIPEIAIWLIRQKEMFGKFINISGGAGYDILTYSYWVAHCRFVVLIYLIILVIVSGISGIIPARIINKVSISEMIKRKD